MDVSPTVTGTNGQSKLSGDVTIGTTNSFFDAATTSSLVAGTYLLNGNIHFQGSALNHALTARIWDGTTTYAEGEAPSSATLAVQISLACVVTLTGTTTLKLSGTSDTGTADVIKAAVTKNSAGNFATILTWVRLA